jgi:ligand-binding sensor domain-containing protein
MKKGIILWIHALIFCMPLSYGQRWEIYNSENSMLPEGGVHALFVDMYGGKWLGTNEGLIYFNGADWSVYTEEDGLVSKVINDLSGAKNLVETKLYVSTSQGVSEVLYDASGLTHLISYQAEDSGLQSDSISTIAVDTSVVYFASRLGLDVQAGDSLTFLDQVSNHEGPVSLKRITSMALTPHGWNYMGTVDAGVARLKYDVDGVTGASSFSTEWSGLLSDQINDIHINEEGNQWYATAKGVAFHEGYETKDNWDTYTELSSELLSNMVHAVAEDSRGTTWAGTDQGISRFDGFSWWSYPFLDGISEYAVFDLDFDLDGSIWFATDFGLIHFDEAGIPDGIAPERHIPELKLRLFPSVVSDVLNLEIETQENSLVSVYVLDLMGRVVHRLADRWTVFGTQAFTWDINDADSQVLEGPYILLVKTNTELLSRKIIIVR